MMPNFWIYARLVCLVIALLCALVAVINWRFAASIKLDWLLGVMAAKPGKGQSAEVNYRTALSALQQMAIHNGFAARAAAAAVAFYIVAEVMPEVFFWFR